MKKTFGYKSSREKVLAKIESNEQYINGLIKGLSECNNLEDKDLIDLLINEINSTRFKNKMLKLELEFIDIYENIKSAFRWLIRGSGLIIDYFFLYF